MNKQIEIRIDKLTNKRYLVNTSTQDIELSNNEEYLFKGMKLSKKEDLIGYTLLQCEKIKSRLIEKFAEANIDVSDIGIVDVTSR